MITRAIQVTVFVRDQAEARQFYIEKLGFVVCMEIEFSPDWQYLAVAPSHDNETWIELSKADTPEKQALIGKQATDQVLLMFASDDIERGYSELKARGVVFHREPKPVPEGIGVRFEDLYSNQFDLYQRLT